MKILVDTHCWLWALSRPDRLNPEAAALLSDRETEIVLSAASVWEIAIKSALGKLRVSETDDSVFEMIEHEEVTHLPILHSHARHVANLPKYHRDPFDRLLIAQAQLEKLPILTADDEFLRYDIEVLWAGQQKPRRRRK